MATIYVFVSTLVIAGALLLLKATDLHYGGKNLFSRLLGKFDSLSERLVSGLKFRLLQLIQSIRYVLFVHLGELGRELAKRLRESLMRELNARREVILGGRKEITHNGSVSFYLKKITENRGEKGKIEESL